MFLFFSSRLARSPLTKSLPVFRSTSVVVLPRQQQQQQHRRLGGEFFSSSSHDPAQDSFQPRTPTQINLEMARGIQNSNLLILKHGIGRQRLELLANAEDDETTTIVGTKGFRVSPLVSKWQRMIEIYLGSQLHVLSALGYPANENGILQYTQQLADFVAKQNDDDQNIQEELRLLGCATWRSMLITAFQLNPEELKEELSIVDARNQAHKVSSRLVEPHVLEEVKKRCDEIPSMIEDPQEEMGMKHYIIQDVIVNKVYLGGLVEELGYGTGPKAYAKMQYVMAYYETDPLCGQYTASAMVKIWKAAGLEFGNGSGGGTLKMPLSPGI